MMNKDIIVSYFKNLKKPLYNELSIIKILDEIKSGRWKEQIKSMRLAKSKERDDIYKKSKLELPCFSTSATFDGTRNQKNIKEYNGLISLDYDNLTNEEVLDVKNEICQLKYTYACFISPSGVGLKVFVRTKSIKENHKAMFLKVSTYYDSKINADSDPSCKDITRLCFVSYDDDLFINEHSIYFDDNLQTEKTISKKIHKENQIKKGERNTYILKIGGRMINKGISHNEVKNKLLKENQINCNPNLKEEEVLSIWKSLCKYEPSIQIKEKNKPDINSHLTDIKIGLIKDIIDTVMPETEAHLMAIVFSFLCSLGNIIGRKFYFPMEGGKHYPNIFICLVGRTAKARKGTSWGRIEEIYNKVDFNWVTDNITSGLYTGEGLIHALRDPRYEYNKKTQQEELVDEGVKDKRLLALESEFSNVLNQSNGKMSILSNVLRNAWDGKTLTTLIKNNREKASNPHVSIIAHITKEELKNCITSSDLVNGFANRFLWVYVERSKKLPLGGDIPEEKIISIANQINDINIWAIGFRGESPITFDVEAEKLWCEMYEDLSEGVEGILGKVTSRSEPQVLRLSLIYAILDKSKEIKSKHLKAAKSLWSYCLKSADYIFDNSNNNIINETIIDYLKNNDNGLSKTEIYKLFHNHHQKEKINMAISFLIQSEKIISKKMNTNGRPKTIYFHTQKQ